MAQGDWHWSQFICGDVCRSTTCLWTSLDGHLFIGQGICQGKELLPFTIDGNSVEQQEGIFGFGHPHQLLLRSLLPLLANHALSRGCSIVLSAGMQTSSLAIDTTTDLTGGQSVEQDLDCWTC